MAFVNPNKPSGLSPVATLSGSPWTGKGRMYYIAAADTNPYYPGDLMTLTASGDPKLGLPGVTLATAGNPAVGVLVAVGLNPDGGPYINPNNLSLTNRPTGAQATPYYALIIDDPNVIFEIQEGGAATNLTNTATSKNANILYAAPAAGVVVSGTTLNGTGVATTSTLNLKLLGLARRADNNFVTVPATGGGAQKWWVLINNHYYRSGVTSI